MVDLSTAKCKRSPEDIKKGRSQLQSPLKKQDQMLDRYTNRICSQHDMAMDYIWITTI